jgi:hypothetical protein
MWAEGNVKGMFRKPGRFGLDGSGGCYGERLAPAAKLGYATAVSEPSFLATFTQRGDDT